MTQKALYLIEFESAHWAGAPEYCVVIAKDEHQAEELASEHMEEVMRELYWDEYHDEGLESYQDSAYSVISVEYFDEKHECWKYYLDETQSQFFPLIGD